VNAGLIKISHHPLIGLFIGRACTAGQCFRYRHLTFNGRRANRGEIDAAPSSCGLNRQVIGTAASTQPPELCELLLGIL
jgi:hypothetical protein